MQTLNSAIAVEPGFMAFPQHFQGVFARQHAAFAPALAQAREILESHTVPEVVRDHYEYAVLEHPQPSFMLFPLMYLELAANRGVVGEAHQRYLPWMMLAMELVAVLDDTVDQTPCRSGRHTYPRRFGASSSAPFSCFLLNTLIHKTMETAPEVLPLVKDLFEALSALQVWEAHDRYPAVDRGSCRRWLQRHYDAVTPAIAYGLNSALVIGSSEPLPLEVCIRFGQIMQDVDDVVNIAERREGAGENSDFKMGIVTHPLLAALEADAELRGLAEAVWRPRRIARQAGAEPSLQEAFLRDDTADVETILQILFERGIPLTLEKIRRDAAACIAATQPRHRGTMHEFVGAFVDRARSAAALSR